MIFKKFYKGYNFNLNLDNKLNKLTILITDSNNNLYYKIIDKYYLNSLLIKLRRYQNEIIYIKIKTLYNLFFF